MTRSYELSSRLEGGEVSDLFRGTQDQSREVTLKLFSPRTSDPEYGKALSTAARKVGELGHPSILHFEDIGVVKERLCCVRAHIDGFHLGTALVRLATKEVVLPPPVALQIMLEVMSALGAAQQAGIVHGALTPANIVVARDGRVFVADFMALWAMQQSLVMKPLSERGRQAYRAPEVAKGAAPDATADVYSVGAILYELLTLREVAASRGGGVSTRRDALPPPSRLDRRVNGRLDPLIMRALEQLKSRRHKGCIEMAEVLRNFLVATGMAAGRQEIAKFVGELFPNEVSVAGVGGELPFKGPFTLEPVAAGRSLPGLAVEIAERVSYSAPAPTETPLPEQRSDGKTSQDLPAPVEAWDAPPGQLDPAVVRFRSGLSAIPESEPLEPPEPSLSSRPTRAELPEVDTDTPVAPPPTAPEVPVMGGAPTVSEGPRIRRPSSAPGARKDEPPPARPEAKPDWHPVYEPRPPPPPAPKTPIAWWLAAVALAAGAAVLTYFAVADKGGGRPMALAHAPIAAPLPPLSPHVPTERPPAERPVTEVHPAAAHAAHAVKASPLPPFCLNISADVRAKVVLDGAVVRSALPLRNYPISSGSHRLRVVPRRGRPQVVELTEADTKCPSPSQLFTFRNGQRHGSR